MPAIILILVIIVAVSVAVDYMTWEKRGIAWMKKHPGQTYIRGYKKLTGRK